MAKITVLGWYNNSNTGDEAYRLAFPKIFPNYQFNFTDKIKEHDGTIILGGGDVLNPAFLNELKKFPEAKKHAMSVNVLKGRDCKDFAGMFGQIIVRNFITLDDISCEGIKFGCLPDFTFILRPNATHGKRLIEEMFIKANADLYENIIIVTLNCYLTPRETTLARDKSTFDKVCYDLARIIDSTNASFIMLPFGNGFPVNDRISNSMVYSKCKFWKKNVMVYDQLSVQDTLDVCAAADAAISSRLHSSIFSCIGDTPFIDLHHHDKTKLFLEFVGKEDWGASYWNFNYDKVNGLLQSFLTDNEKHRVGLRAVTSKSRKVLSDFGAAAFL